MTVLLGFDRNLRDSLLLPLSLGVGRAIISDSAILKLFYLNDVEHNVFRNIKNVSGNNYF